MEVNPDIENILSRRFDVKLFDKNNKTETGSLNFSHYEITIQSRAQDGRIKISKSIAYPDISCITIKDNDNVVLDFSEKNSQVIIQMEEPLYLIKCVYIVFKIYFPCEDIFTFFTMKSDNGQIESVKDELNKLNFNPQSPCNNFTYGIKFYAKYSYLVENEEVIWDIDTVYASKDTKKFCLKDFDHLKSKYLIPVLGTMCYNTYFNELSLSYVDLSPYEKVIERIFKYNKKFRKLYFVNCNLKLSLCSAIAQGLEGQKGLVCLDLSCNDGISDKGLDLFLPFLKKFSQYLEVFKMSRCNLSNMSICKIADAFTYNVRGDDCPIQLRVLDLSYNNLKEGFKEIFHDFLSKCNFLEDLNLSGMNISIEQIPISLSKGPINSLKYLNLSDNICPSSIQTCTHWSNFSKNVASLMQINLSNFKFLNCSITDGLLYGFPENISLSSTGVEVIISNSSLNGSYLNRFIDFISKAKFITYLDLSSNGIDVEGGNIFKYLPEFSSLKSLNISNNFINVKPKDQQTIIISLTNALQLENVNLQELYLANCNFGTNLSYLISELDSFFSLLILDISGNNIGNILARTLGRMLTIDKHLKEILMDNNNIAKEIYEEILDGLEKNFTLTTFHVPIVDLVKYPPKLIVPLIEKINKHHIKVNKIFQGISFEDVKAMAFSCMMNQTTENIDKCKTTLQESCNRLKSVNCLDDNLVVTIKKSLERSLDVIKTVDKSKDLLSKLNGIYKNNTSKPNLSTDLGIKIVIEEICMKISELLNDYMHEITEELTNEIYQTLPSLWNGNNALQTELMDICNKSLVIPNEYIKKLFERFIEQNLVKKVYETEINVTNLLCDRITDEIISQINLCDINTNKLFNLSRSCNNNITPSTSSAPDYNSNEPLLRSMDDKKDRTTTRQTVRNSRMSYLATNKSRPISKAIKTNLELEKLVVEPKITKPVVPERTKRIVTVKFEQTNKNPVPEDDLINSLKERPKPKKNVKSKVTSPNTPILEQSPAINEELWNNFHSSSNSDNNIDNPSKKKTNLDRKK